MSDRVWVSHCEALDTQSLFGASCCTPLLQSYIAEPETRFPSQREEEEDFQNSCQVQNLRRRRL